MVKIVRKERHYIDYIDEYQIPEELYKKIFLDREDLPVDIWDILADYHVEQVVDQVSNRRGDYELDIDVQLQPDGDIVKLF